MIHQLRTELHNQRREKEQNGEWIDSFLESRGWNAPVVTDET